MELKQLKRLVNGGAGTILVEYVVVLCFLGIAVYWIFIEEFYSADGYQGALGSAVLIMMQRILEGIAMPIPY